MKHVCKNLLLLTNTIDESAAGGRELLCKLNRDALKDIYADRCIVFQLDRNPVRGLKSILNAFKGHIDGLSDETVTEILQQIWEQDVKKLFVDGSNFGEFVRVVKKRYPEIQVCTFFHNVEARFFWGALKQTKTPQALAVFMVNYLAERKSVRYSDKVLCLSTRDSDLLSRFYGRSATDILPMALQDKLPDRFTPAANRSSEKYMLFVGGGFYANRAGISWFVKHVVPCIHIKTCIVGRGLEDLKQQLEEGNSDKVEVVGAVTSLAEWYQSAHFVIAPIFDGSGMKTKVAEALMFGKKIVGSPEAFSGYEEIVERAGWPCDSVDGFVAAIAEAEQSIDQLYDPELRTLYEKKYSYDAARSRLARVLEVTQ